jgi:hypothetical protein
MVDTGELESFLNDKSAKEDDVIEILDEGLLEAKKDPVSNREYKVLNLPVSVNGKKIVFSPNSEAIKVFQKVKGLDTKNWVGLKFHPKFYPKTAFGVTRTAILPVIIG